MDTRRRGSDVSVETCATVDTLDRSKTVLLNAPILPCAEVAERISRVMGKGENMRALPCILKCFDCDCLCLLCFLAGLRF